MVTPCSFRDRWQSSGQICGSFPCPVIQFGICLGVGRVRVHGRDATIRTTHWVRDHISNRIGFHYERYSLGISTLNATWHLRMRCSTSQLDPFNAEMAACLPSSEFKITVREISLSFPSNVSILSPVKNTRSATMTQVATTSFDRLSIDHDQIAVGTTAFARPPLHRLLPSLTPYQMTESLHSIAQVHERRVRKSV